MSLVNIFDAKARLSEYLDRAAKGEQIVICRHNKPIAELRALDPARLEPRPVGPIQGRPTFELPPAFFEPLDDDELRMWEGLPQAASSWGASPTPAPQRKAMVAERRPKVPAKARPRTTRRRS